jgi:opine dehydrogenase
LAIGEKYGLSLDSTLTQLKNYYGDNDAQSIYEYVNSDQSPYKEIWGHSTHSRYITEDAPYLLTPMMQMGQKAGVESKWFEMCVALASMLHDVDYTQEGNNLEKLGVQAASVEEIKQLAHAGS